MDREFLKGDMEQSLSYSRAVIVRGAETTVYLAGVACPFGPDGQSFAGDFSAQARGCFEKLERVLSECGGTLSDVVTTTMFVTDMRSSDALVGVIRDAFGEDFPAATLIGVDCLVLPQMLLEIQATAVLAS